MKVRINGPNGHSPATDNGHSPASDTGHVTVRIDPT